MSFSIGQVRYIDSMQFMGFGLEKLANNLDVSDLHHTSDQFPVPEQFDLVQRKGVYPYDFVTSFEAFQ